MAIAFAHARNTNRFFPLAFFAILLGGSFLLWRGRGSRPFEDKNNGKLPPSLLRLAFPPRISSAAVKTTKEDFCADAFDASPSAAGTFARVLLEGSPRFWIVPPLPDFDFLVTEGATGKSGGAVVSSMKAQFAPFQEYFRDSPPDALMIDIGGNVGLASLPVAAMGRQVIAFEPVPRNLRVFSLSVCFNGFWDRFALVGAAVGATNSVANIFVPRGRADNTAMVETVSTANVGGTTDRISVPVVALDSWVKSHLWPADIQRIWLIKIDVQGYETRVMEGAKAVLTSLPLSAWVVAEHDPKLMAGSGLSDKTADIAFMASLGFSAHLTWRGPEVAPENWATVPLGEYGRDMWYKRRLAEQV